MTLMLNVNVPRAQDGCTGERGVAGLRKQLLKQIKTLDRPLPAPLMRSDIKPSMNNRSNRFILMGIHECYPALAGHRASGFSRRDISSGVQANSGLEAKSGVRSIGHNGHSLQGSISMPNLVPGLGFLSPSVAFEEKNTLVLNEYGQSQDLPNRTIPDLVDGLSAGDSLQVEQNKDLSFGLSGSTSAAIPGLSTPTLFANAMVNAVLMPCVLLAVSGGLQGDSEQKQAMVFDKRDSQIRVESRKSAATSSQKTLGIKTVCWMMWLASIAIEAGKALRPNGGEASKPTLWHSLHSGVNIELLEKSQTSTSLGRDLSLNTQSDQTALKKLLERLDAGQNEINGDFFAQSDVGLEQTTEKTQALNLQLLHLFKHTSGVKESQIDRRVLSHNSDLVHTHVQEQQVFSTTKKSGRVDYHQAVSSQARQTQLFGTSVSGSASLQQRFLVEENFAVANQRADRVALLAEYVSLAQAFGDSAHIDWAMPDGASDKPVKVSTCLSLPLESLQQGATAMAALKITQPLVYETHLKTCAAVKALTPEVLDSSLEQLARGLAQEQGIETLQSIAARGQSILHGLALVLLPFSDPAAQSRIQLAIAFEPA